MHAIEQPIARSLYLESWLIVWSSFWLAVLFVGVIVVLVFRWPWLVAVALPVFLISQGVAMAFAFRFRCPACDRRLLVQGFGPWHPARKILFPASLRGSPSRSTLLVTESSPAYNAGRGAP